MQSTTESKSTFARLFLLEKTQEKFIPLKMVIDTPKKHIALIYTCPLKSTTIGIEIYHPVALQYLRVQKSRSCDIAETIRSLPIEKGWCTSSDGTIHIYFHEKKMDIILDGKKHIYSLTREIKDLFYELHTRLLVCLELHPNIRLNNQ